MTTPSSIRPKIPIAEQLTAKAVARAELFANIATCPLQLDTAKPEVVSVRMFFEAVKEYLDADAAFDEQVKQLVGTQP